MTDQANKVISIRRNIENEIEILEESNDADQNGKEIDNLIWLLEENQVCEFCEGEGEVVNHQAIHGNTIDVPYTICKSCYGSGIKDRI